jgi:hypothetical protein
MQHIEVAMEDLNARIARLAIALGLSLQDEQDMARVMSAQGSTPPGQERRSAPAGQPAARSFDGAERRKQHSWAELRGLIVLRYDMQKHSVEQVGLVATRLLMGEAEDHLSRRGFKPGVDGVHLDSLADDA